jgi:hypothetical protein
LLTTSRPELADNTSELRTVCVLHRIVCPQERWEAEQAKRTRRGGGNIEVIAEAAARDAEKYEMLFDDQIEYIKVRWGGGDGE